MSERTIFVTGGAGFIGSHVSKRLACCGWVPVTFDNLSTGHRDAVRWGPFEFGDVRDQESLAQAITRYKPRAIMHFAAVAYVGESVYCPEKYYANNVAGTYSVLEASRSAGCLPVVFSSSCATYGSPSRVPIDEAEPQSPVNPYGRTKLIGEMMLRDFGAAHELPYAGLRYFNAAGADPDREIWERHVPETHLIPRALLAAAGLEQELTIFGNDYPTPDGTCVRDFIHVMDLAEGHRLALDSLLSGSKSFFLNLGSGTGLSVLDIVAGIERLTRRKLPVVFEQRRPGDPAALVASPNRAREQLGFKTRYSDIETILRTAAPFFGIPDNS